MLRWMSATSLALSFAILPVASLAGDKAAAPAQAVSDAEADRRAARLVDAMTLEEQLQLLRPVAATSYQFAPAPTASRKACVPRRPPARSARRAMSPPSRGSNWPAVQESDGPIGVANMKGWIRGIDDQATNFPSSIAWAASFDPALARRVGAVIGEEAHAKGFNVMLAGGVNLRAIRAAAAISNMPARIRCSRDGSRVRRSRVSQARNVVSTLKHYALNDQESGRGVL